MNRLPTEKRVQIVHMLVEGCSMRAAARLVGVSINTVVKLLIDVGDACQAHHDATVRGLRMRRLQCDELWSFCYAKDKALPEAVNAPESGAGSIWTWAALDTDSRLLVSCHVGDRTQESALAFMRDLYPRVLGRTQIVTDGLKVYMVAVKETFGNRADHSTDGKGYAEGYSSEAGSTNHVERQNLNIRMGNRRYTRRTNAFSKKLERHVNMLAIYASYYNFVRPHITLKTTPAVAAGLAVRPWTVADGL